VIDLDMLCPPGLSGAPVIREDRREVIGVIFEEQTTTMYERTVIFGRAHHLDVLRSARAAVTGGRPLRGELGAVKPGKLVGYCLERANSPPYDGS
jgi:hypothetical protein